MYELGERCWIAQVKTHWIDQLSLGTLHLDDRGVQLDKDGFGLKVQRAAVCFSLVDSFRIVEQVSH